MPGFDPQEGGLNAEHRKRCWVLRRGRGPGYHAARPHAMARHGSGRQAKGTWAGPGGPAGAEPTSA